MSQKHHFVRNLCLYQLSIRYPSFLLWYSMCDKIKTVVFSILVIFYLDFKVKLKFYHHKKSPINILKIIEIENTAVFKLRNTNKVLLSLVANGLIDQEAHLFLLLLFLLLSWATSFSSSFFVFFFFFLGYFSLLATGLVSNLLGL